MPDPAKRNPPPPILYGDEVDDNTALAKMSVTAETVVRITCAHHDNQLIRFNARAACITNGSVVVLPLLLLPLLLLLDRDSLLLPVRGRVVVTVLSL